MTISSAIVDSAAAIRLTKSGPGTLILESANTFTRGTEIVAGTVRLSGAGRLPAGREVILNEGASLDLNGVSQTVGALTGSAGSAITLGGATLTLGVGSRSSPYAFDGIISGPGGLRKVGVSTQFIRGAQTYSGPTFIDAGFIELAGNGSLPSGTALAFGNGSTQVGLNLAGHTQTVGNLESAFAGAGIFGPGTITVGGGDGSYAGDFFGVVNFIKDGLGTTTVLAGNNGSTDLTVRAGTLGIATSPRSITFEGGTLQLRADFVLPSTGTVPLSGAVGIIDTNGFSASLSAVISGAGALTKIGEGTLSLSGSNTFSGGVRVNGGTLAVTSNAALGASANVVRLDTGTLATTGNISRNVLLTANGGSLGSSSYGTFSGVVSGVGRLDVNSGIVTVSAQNTYAGGTQIGGSGALLASGGNRVFGSGPVAVQPGGLVGIASSTNLAPGVLVPLQPGAALAVLDTALDPAALIDPDPAKTTGGIVALGVATYDRALDLAAIGNGRLFLSAFGAARYTPATLGAGSDGIYRLGGSGNFGPSLLTVGGADNVLTGPKSLLIGNGNAPANGTVILLNANDFSGGTTLAGGTLALGHARALGSGALAVTGGTLRADAALAVENSVLLSGDLGIGASAFPLTLNGSVDLGGGTRRITFAGASQVSPVVQINGRISNGTLFKGGAGVLTLTAANDYAGGTIILGTLRSLAQDALGTGPIVLASNLVFENVPQTLANPIAISDLGGPAILNFNVPTTVTSAVSSTGALTHSLYLSGPANATLSGAISDGAKALSLTVSGTGIVSISGINSYHGSTTFERGTGIVTTDANLGIGGGFFSPAGRCAMERRSC